MAETFNLSVRSLGHPNALQADKTQDKDRFTMLSGIAHDPIQRYVVPVARLPAMAFDYTANRRQEIYSRLFFLAVGFVGSHSVVKADSHISQSTRPRKGGHSARKIGRMDAYLQRYRDPFDARNGYVDQAF